MVNYTAPVEDMMFQTMDLFSTPIWIGEEINQEKLKDLNYASDQMIIDAKNLQEKEIIERNKIFGEIKDKGFTFHSENLVNKKSFLELQFFIEKNSTEFLTQMGYDLKKYKMNITEMWVQEFSKNGCGWHRSHNHWNGHISGFLFLKCSEKTSYPILQDPRVGKLMNDLPQLDSKKIDHSSNEVNLTIKPGLTVFFPSYLMHEFVPDLGIDPFRFIHWNCQAIPKSSKDNDLIEL